MFQILAAAALLSTMDGAAAELHFHGVARLERDGDQSRRGYGLDARTTFWVASISKSFTAALILRLADLGKLGLEERVLGSDVTIDELLTHTSGLPRATYLAEGESDPPVARRAGPGELGVQRRGRDLLHGSRPRPVHARALEGSDRRAPGAPLREAHPDLRRLRRPRLLRLARRHGPDAGDGGLRAQRSGEALAGRDVDRSALGRSGAEARGRRAEPRNGRSDRG